MQSDKTKVHTVSASRTHYNVLNLFHDHSSDPSYISQPNDSFDQTRDLRVPVHDCHDQYGRTAVGIFGQGLTDDTTSLAFSLL